VLLVDPYNDFLSEGGKLFPRAKAIAEEVGVISNNWITTAYTAQSGYGIIGS
jgi:hypothetical protein